MKYRPAILVLGLMVCLLGCSSALIFNPAFVNQSSGDLFPLTPGDSTNFILVRGNNTTSDAIEFVITAERRITSLQDDGVSEIVVETRRVLTQPNTSSNDLGVLFDCPVVRVGLGETLDQPTTEPGLYVGAEAVGQGGLGVPPNANPLSSEAPYLNFDCGDTIIFQASAQAGVPGGVGVTAFVLDDETQPTDILGFDTFKNARTLIEDETTIEEDDDF